MQKAIDETRRRRELQEAHNAEHGITPQSVVKSVEQVRFITRVADARTERDGREAKVAEPKESYAATLDLEGLAASLEAQMKEAALALDYEAAARLRDELFEVRARLAGAPVKAAGARGSGALGGLRSARSR